MMLNSLLRPFRPTNGIQWLTLALVVVVTVGFIYGFQRLSYEQAHQNDALRSLICRAELFVRKQPDASITAKQRHEALKFYRDALRAANLAPCS